MPHAPAPLRLPPRPLPRWRARAFVAYVLWAFALPCACVPPAASVVRTCAEFSASEPGPSLPETPADPSHPPARAAKVPGSAAAGVRAVVRQRRGTPPPAPASRRRMGWPAAPATARLQFTAPSAPPAGLLRHGSADQQGTPKAAGDQAPAFQGRRNNTELNYNCSHRGGCGHSCCARQCPGAV